LMMKAFVNLQETQIIGMIPSKELLFQYFHKRI
jgi:hypothetical protein